MQGHGWEVFKLETYIVILLWPLRPHWPQQPLQPYFLKKLPGPDGLVITSTGTKITDTGHFL